MDAPRPTKVVVAFGDSITDGTASTINGDDRWPDVLARRLHGAYGNTVAIVNQGIGGNQVIGPAIHSPGNVIPGGPSALSRLERDVIALPAVSAVIWLEGINDFGTAKAGAEEVINGVREGVKRLRARIPGVRIVMATLTSSLHAVNNTHGTPEVEQKRQAFNTFVRGAGIFDAVVDFDKVTIDPKTGELKAEFQPNSSIGGPGDKLHPNRLGYQAMGNAFDLSSVIGNWGLIPKNPYVVELAACGILAGIKYREDVVEGLENAPAAFLGLLRGNNFGKAIVEEGAGARFGADLKDRIGALASGMEGSRKSRPAHSLALGGFLCIFCDK